MDYLITVENAAERLAISRTTAYKLVRQGALASVKIGKSRRVRASAVDEFMSAGTGGGGGA